MVFTEEGTFIRRRYLRTKVKVTCKLVLSRFLAFHRQIVTFLKMDDPFKIPLGHDTFVLLLDERHAEKQNIAFMYE